MEISARKQLSAWLGRSLPVVLVAFMWFWVWRLWPSPGHEVWRPARKPFAVRFCPEPPQLDRVKDPSLLAFASDISFRDEEAQESSGLRTPEFAAAKGRPLGMGKGVVETGGLLEPEGYSVWSRLEGGFRNAWQEGVVSRGVISSQQYVVVLSEDLEKAGFGMPDLGADGRRLPVLGWEVQLMVDIGSDGLAEHVLVEKGSGNGDIDKLVVGGVLRGRAVNGRDIRGGRVTVSCGRE